MSRPSFAALVSVIATVCLSAAPASPQSQSRSAADTTSAGSVPRTPDGRPDLQGLWTTQTFTLLERPDHLAGKEFFTAEEVAALNQQLTAEGVDPSARDAINIADPEAREKRLYQTNREPGYIHYDNNMWLRTSVPKGLTSRRTSLITDPKDGKLPPLTQEAARRAAAEAEASRKPSAFDSYETRPLPERCIAWAHEGPPILPPAYNDIHQIFQTRDYVVVNTELRTHPPRIIPLDGRSHLAQGIRQWLGDSRGRWDGNTLIVETTNFTDRVKDTGLTVFGIGQNARLVERFTRVDAETIDYQITVNDPGVFTRPWTAAIPMTRIKGPLFEYACHEGNYGLEDILKGARTREKTATKTGSR